MRRVPRTVVAAGVAALVTVSALAATAAGSSAKTETKPLRIGIVSFLTGPAAPPFGVPARNGAKVLIDALNRGKAPKPYNRIGIGGRKIQAIYLDENASPDQNVANYRRLVQDKKVDLVIGYISSEDCLAVGPVADQLRQFTVFFDCGTSQLFAKPLPYVYRTAGDQSTDAIAAARYVLALKGKVKSIAGINQNYAWGQDNWATFSAAMKKLDPGVQIKDALFPNIFAGQYSTEISKLLADRPDVIYSSFWGGDLDSLLQQGLPRGLAKSSTLVFNAADTALPELGKNFPAGVVVGARGPHGVLAPKSNRLNSWIVAAYRARYHAAPVYPVWHIAQAILGVKAAYEHAMAKYHTKTPTQAQWMASLKGSSFQTPSGTISMQLSGGHQAVEGNAYGISAGFDSKTGEVRLTKVKSYPAACVDAPNGTSVEAWIGDGFKGARCP